MAQTTSDVSFGPVFIVPAQSITYLVIRTYIYSRTLVSIQKKMKEKEKKNSPMAQTMRLASFGPVLVVANLPVVYIRKTIHYLNLLEFTYIILTTCIY